MESLLRLSGLLGEDDDDTDLGTLEKKLAEKQRETSRQGSQAASNPSSPSHTVSGNEESTPHSSVASPEHAREGEGAPGSSAAGPSGGSTENGGKKSASSSSEKKSGKKEEEAESLSEMMCSLVTNNFGETRYIGKFSSSFLFPSAL